MATLGSQPPAGAGPLAGVRVVELAAFMSGPFAAMMLADLGADVVKVEPPRGDLYRRFMRPSTVMSPQFADVNRNKASLALDLKSAAGRDRLLRLLEDADVLVTNWRPGALARSSITDEGLAAANPRLIRCYLSGFGSDGPDAQRPAFDGIIQAQSAMADSVGDDDGPALAPNYLADAISASMTAQAILAALVARGTTGRAERIDVAMLDAVAYFSFPSAMSHRTFLDHDGDRARNPHSRPARPIAASDGWLVVSAVSAAQIRGACNAVGHPEWADDLLATPDGGQIGARLLDRMEEVTPSGPVARWLTALAANDVAAARCLTADEHFADPQVIHNDLYQIEDWPGLGRVRQVRYPARYSSWSRLATRTPAPGLGESAHPDEEAPP